jgi:tetratricopeptide (TPR) repeat protein
MTGNTPALAAAISDVEAAIRANDIAAAIERATSALAAGLEHPLLLNLRAHGREQAGRPQEALADLERGQALAPADPNIANARGLCLAALGRMAEAAAAFDLCARSAPGFAPGHYNRGWASETIGELTVAGEAYRRTLELAPGHADAAAGMAFLAARRGDGPAARTFAEQALALRPGLMKATLALAQAEIGDRDFPAAEARLRLALDRDAPAQAPQFRAMALGLLGDALDGRGRIDEAFATYQAENDLTRRLNEAEYAGPGVHTAPQFLAWVSDYFEQASPDAWMIRRSSGGPASPAASHVFLIGFPRSGTTLLENVLAGAPEVVTLEEREVLADGVRAFMSKPAGLDRLLAASDEELEPFRAAYWRRVRELGGEPDGRVFIDKLPLNTFKLPLIARLFPQARVIFSVRDPRDVVLSCFRRHFSMNPSMFEFLTLEGTARFYAATLDLFELYRDRLGVEPHMLRYEDMVEDFESTTRAACVFLGVEWRPELAAFATRAASKGIATPSATQVARGLYRQGIGQWRPYEAHLAPVMPILEQWIVALGYPRD